MFRIQARRARGLAVVALTAPALALATMAVPQAGAAPSVAASVTVEDPNDVLSHAVSDDEVRSTGEYWTQERMRGAIPAGAQLSDAEIKEQAARATEPIEKGAPTTGSTPVGAEDAAKGGRDIRIGKVFFRQAGKDYVCSGAAVNTKKKNMVWTAGHCVNGVGKVGWSKKFAFYPGLYIKNGQYIAPRGGYLATRLATSRGWVKNSSFNYDYALALVRPWKYTKKPLVKNVGGFGIQFGKKFKRSVKAVGYSSRGYNGGQQKVCKRVSHQRKGTRQLEIYCKVLTPGASGGPWLVGRYLNGVNSNVDRYDPAPRVIRTPYFGVGARQLFRKYN